MKKEALKKLAVTAICFIFLIVVAVAYTKMNDTTEASLYDLNLPFAIFAILISFWEEKNNLFQKLWMRYLFIVLVGSYILSVTILYFTKVNIILIINDLIALSILIVLAFSLVSRLFQNQISTDVKLLKKTAKKNLTSSNNLSNAVDKTFSEIKIWISKSNSHKESDFKEIVLVSEMMFERVLNADVSLSRTDQEADLLKIEANYIELLRLGIGIKHEDLVLNSLCKMQEMAYSTGYYELLKITSSTLTEFVDIMFSLSSRFTQRQSIFMQELFNSITEIIKFKENDRLNELIFDIANNILHLYRKYNYNLKEEVFILMMQGYGNTINTMENNGISFDYLDSSKNMIHLLNSEYKNKDLELFYIVRLTSSINNLEDAQSKIERIVLLFDIIKTNDLERFALIYLVNQASEIIQESTEIDIKSIELYVNMILNLPEKNSLHPEFNFVYDFLQKQSNEQFVNFTKNILSPRNEQNENIEFIFRSIGLYLTEPKLEFSSKLLIEFINQTSFVNFHGDFSLMRQVFLSILSLTNRKYSGKTKELNAQFSSILEVLLDLGKAIPNNEFVASVINVLNFFDNNDSVEDLISKNLLMVGYNAIESNQADSIIGVSNSIGWIINRMIKDIVVEDTKKMEKIKNRIKKSVNYFKAVCTFSSENSSIFVGTLFVVNMTQLKAYESEFRGKESKRSEQIYSEFLKRIKKELSCNEIGILIKSCKLRKNLIDDYVESKGTTPKELVNTVIKDLTAIKKSIQGTDPN